MTIKADVLTQCLSQTGSTLVGCLNAQKTNGRPSIPDSCVDTILQYETVKKPKCNANRFGAAAPCQIISSLEAVSEIFKSLEIRNGTCSEDIALISTISSGDIFNCLSSTWNYTNCIHLLNTFNSGLCQLCIEAQLFESDINQCGLFCLPASQSTSDCTRCRKMISRTAIASCAYNDFSRCSSQDLELFRSISSMTYGDCAAREGGTMSACFNDQLLLGGHPSISDDCLDELSIRSTVYINICKYLLAPVTPETASSCSIAGMMAELSQLIPQYMTFNEVCTQSDINLFAGAEAVQFSRCLAQTNTLANCVSSSFVSLSSVCLTALTRSFADMDATCVPSCSSNPVGAGCTACRQAGTLRTISNLTLAANSPTPTITSTTTTSVPASTPLTTSVTEGQHIPQPPDEIPSSAGTLSMLVSYITIALIN